MSVASRRT